MDSSRSSNRSTDHPQPSVVNLGGSAWRTSTAPWKKSATAWSTCCYRTVRATTSPSASYVHAPSGKVTSRPGHCPANPPLWAKHGPSPPGNSLPGTWKSPLSRRTDRQRAGDQRHPPGFRPGQPRLIRDINLIFEVSDGSHTSPHLRRARTNDEGGRGPFAVARFAQHWETRYTTAGRTIWTEQPPMSRSSASAAAHHRGKEPDYA